MTNKGNEPLEKFIKLGSYETERMAVRIADSVNVIAKELNLKQRYDAVTFVKFIVSEYENYRIRNKV